MSHVYADPPGPGWWLLQPPPDPVSGKRPPPRPVKVDQDGDALCWSDPWSLMSMSTAVCRLSAAAGWTWLPTDLEAA